MSTLNVILGVSRRTLKNALTNPQIMLPTMAFPLFFFTAFAGGLSQISKVPGFDYAPGYTSFQFVFVLLQSAAFSGVFGFKPTFGLVPAYPLSPFGTVANLGPITVSVEDAACMLTIMSRPDPRDWYGSTTTRSWRRMASAIALFDDSRRCRPRSTIASS